MESNCEDLAWQRRESEESSSDYEFLPNLDFTLDPESGEESEEEVEQEAVKEVPADTGKTNISSKPTVTLAVSRYHRLYLNQLFSNQLAQLEVDTFTKINFNEDDGKIEIYGETSESMNDAKSALLEIFDRLSEPVLEKGELWERFKNGPKSVRFLRKYSIQYLLDESRLVIIYCTKQYPFNHLKEELLDKYMYHGILFYHLLLDNPSSPKELSLLKENTKVMVKFFKEKMLNTLTQKAEKYGFRFAFQEEVFPEANALHFERSDSIKTLDCLWYLRENYLHPLCLVRITFKRPFSEEMRVKVLDFLEYAKEDDLFCENQTDSLILCGLFKDIRNVMDNLKYQIEDRFPFFLQATEAHVVPKFTSRKVAKDIEKNFNEKSKVLWIGFSSYCISSTGKELLEEVYRFLDFHDETIQKFGREFQIDFTPLDLDVKNVPKFKRRERSAERDKGKRTHGIEKSSEKVKEKDKRDVRKEHKREEKRSEERKGASKKRPRRETGPQDRGDCKMLPSTYESQKQYGHFQLMALESEANAEKKELENQVDYNVEVKWRRHHGKSIARFTLSEVFDKNAVQFRSVDFHLSLPKPKSNRFIWQGRGRIEDFKLERNEVEVSFVKEDAPPMDVQDWTTGYTARFMWNGNNSKRMRDAIRSFTTDRGNCELNNKIKDILLGMCPDYRPQQRSQALQIPEKFSLNKSQEEAISMALASPLMLIQGPPGTGKTTTSAALVYAMFHYLPKKQNLKVLVCAPSNVVTDELSKKILERTGLTVLRFVGKAREPQCDALPLEVRLEYHREKLSSKARKEANIRKQANQDFDRNRRGDREEEEFTFSDEDVIRSVNVVCCTCSSAGDRRLMDTNFDVVLIDEATMAIEPQCLVAITKGTEKLILVGDHKQLGPVVKSSSAANAGLSISLFERLLNNGIQPKMLNIQYRMHPNIASFSSMTFYDGKIENGVNEEDRDLTHSRVKWPGRGLQTFFWHVKGGSERVAADEGKPSYYNDLECSKVSECIEYLTGNCQISPESIGVITPYKGQENMIRRRLNHFDRKIEIKSVDGFQGREKVTGFFCGLTFQGHYHYDMCENPKDGFPI